MIGKVPQANCPVCSHKIKRPYLTSYSAYGEKRLYECPKCALKFAIVLDYKTGDEKVEAD
jgi:hypothetical protein